MRQPARRRTVAVKPSAQTAIFPRVDNPALPFADKRVRRALSMGIDMQAVANAYYGGNAELLACPVANIAEFSALFTPVDKLPQSTRELFEYNPQQAKKLLAEAGYPGGFKTEILLTAGSVDLASLVKADWAKIGVDLTLNVKEYGVYTSMMMGKTFKEMLFSGASGVMPHKMPYDRWPSPYNFGMNQDAVIMEAYDKIQAAYFDWPEVIRLLRDYIRHTLDQVYLILLPTPWSYNFWQPWLKGYSGELQTHYKGLYGWFEYAWLDLDLKEQTTGRK